MPESREDGWRWKIDHLRGDTGKLGRSATRTEALEWHKCPEKSLVPKI